MKKILPYHLHFLFISAIFFWLGYIFLNKKPATPDLTDIAAQIEQYLLHQEAKVESIIEDEVLIQKILSDSLSEKELHWLHNQEPVILLYQRDSLIFWSKNKAFPPQEITAYKQYDELVKLKNGYYEIIKKSISSADSLSLVAMIPVKYKYEIQNNYLQNHFVPSVPDNIGIAIFEESSEAMQPVNNERGEVLFFIYQESEPEDANPNIFSVLLLITGFLFLLIFINYFSVEVGLRINSFTGFIVLLLLFLLARYLNLLYFYPPEIRQISFFNPQIYGSSKMAPSLGDLFLNILMVLWVVVYFFRMVKVKARGKDGVFVANITTIIGYLFILQLIYLISRVTRSLVMDSNISFNINNFLSLDIFSLVGLVCMALMLISLYLFTYKYIILTKLMKVTSAARTMGLGGAVLLFVLIKYMNSVEFLNVLLIGIVFLVLLNWFIQKKIYILGFTSIIVWLIFFSIFTALLLNKYNAEKEWQKRKLYAYTLAEDKDIVAEYLFSEIKPGLQEDPFIKGYFQNPFIQKSDLEEWLNRRYFRDKLNKYNIDVHTYIRNDVPYKEEENILLRDFVKMIDSTGRRTGIQNLYFFPGTGTSFKYLAVLNITDAGNDNLLGRLVLEFQPKTFSFSNVYPELLLEEDLKIPREFEDYDYAIYINNKLQKNQGEYPYDLYEPHIYQNEYEIKEENNFKHLIYSPHSAQSIWISREVSSNFEPVSLFSYIFGLYLFIVLIIAGVRFAYILYTNNFQFNKLINVTFRNRIQFFIISIIVVSFLLIGTLTILNISRQYEDYHHQRLLRKVKQVLAGLDYMKNDLDSLPQRWTMLFANEDILFQDVATLSDIHSMDINIFDSKGQLISSSQPNIFNKGLVTSRIDPVAFHNIIKYKKSQFIQMEQIGKLNYLSAYVPILDERRNITGILNLPYFAKEKNLEKEISDFLVYFINVYVLLLVFAGIIGVIISNSITRPITEIGSKLKQVKLGKPNEPIKWEMNDEIGRLVYEYNKMIGELENSAELLARSERESAWREMAKQVAHEIKNPLTPMKLSIQHLQRAYRDKAPNIDNLIENVTNTLIEQIENLSSIASEFSSFAKMPLANREKINVNELLRSVGELFKNQEAEITIQIPSTDYYVYADKGQLIRVFNNVIKNALQAIPDEREGKIFVGVKREDEHILIKIEDNGIGITAEQQEKVFVPNFTTKGSGMGLGLAITKNIIESAGGRIWFDSEENIGTTFFIELPVYQDEK